MKELFALCESEQKEFVEISEGTHNDTCVKPGYWASIKSFWHKYVDASLE
jgi:hypothetical protein